MIVNDLFPDTADSVVATIVEAGGTALAVPGNIGNPAVAEKLVSTALEHYGQLDILINNAGIEIKKSFGDFSSEDFRRMMDVHVFGSWTLTHLAWPHMRSRGYGKVLFVSSNSLFGMNNNAAYVTAKGALFGMTKSLAFEGPKYGINVNALGPIALTAMAKQMTEDPRTHAWMEQTLPASATSPVVAWLVHKDCNINGEFISSYGANFGRIFMAETKGVHFRDGAWTPELVRDHFSQVFDETDYITAKSTDELVARLFAVRTETLAEPGSS